MLRKMKRERTPIQLLRKREIREDPPKRSGLKRKTRLRPISKRRAEERKTYRDVREEHLAAHPFCQITIAQFRVNEADVIKSKGLLEGPVEMVRVAEYPDPIPLGSTLVIHRATQIHHRNKCDGSRLNDPRFFMSACRKEHEWAERHKDEARAIGVLLPINADKDGRMPDGSRCLTTDELLAVRARGGNETCRRD